MCRIETVFFLELHMNVETWNRCEHACMNSMYELHVYTTCGRLQGHSL